MTEYHKPGGLDERNVYFLHSFGDSESKIKVLPGLVSGEASLSGHLLMVFSHSLPSVCACLIRTPVLSA